MLTFHNNIIIIVVGHINVVAALLGFLVRKSMDMLQCDDYNQGHLDKVERSDYKKITIHFKKVSCQS